MDETAQPQLPISDETLNREPSADQNREGEIENETGFRFSSSSGVNANDAAAAAAGGREDGIVRSRRNSDAHRQENSNHNKQPQQVTQNELPATARTIASFAVESSPSPSRFIGTQENTNAVVSSSTEPNHHFSPHSPPPPAQQQQQQHSTALNFGGVDPIGRLLSFNAQAVSVSSEREDSSSESEESKRRNDTPVSASATPAAAAAAASPNNMSQKSDSSLLSGAREPSTNKTTIRDPDAPVVVSVAQRRKNAAALRVPLNSSSNNNNTNSSTPTGDDFQYQHPHPSSLTSAPLMDPTTGANNSKTKPDVLSLELPQQESPISKTKDAMSLVTVLEEYDVLKNCRGWFTEAHHRTVQAMLAQGEQLLDWQRRRLEQQSETVLDELAIALNPTTLSEMFDAVASALDEMEAVLEPAFVDRMNELTSLTRATSSTDALASYANLLSVEADRIQDQVSQIHVTLDSIRADLAETRSADAAFDLERRQARRVFAQKLTSLEEDHRHLKHDLRRELRISADRDKTSEIKFENLHGQLEALLNGVEMFEQLHKEVDIVSDELQHVTQVAGHAKEEALKMASGQEDTSPSSSSSSPTMGGDHSPASKSRVKFYQRVAAISRKLKEHGYDVASMMIKNSKKNSNNFGEEDPNNNNNNNKSSVAMNISDSLQIPLYQQTNTTCYVDPTIVFATNNARDLGGIEDVADEYFAPMAIESYNRRAERSANNSRSGSADSSSSSSLVTPNVPSPLTTKEAQMKYLEDEARSQAAEIMSDALFKMRMQEQQEKDLRENPHYPHHHHHHHHPQNQQQRDPSQTYSPYGSPERPRIPAAGIPDSHIDPNRVVPDLPSAHKVGTATTLQDLVPPALMELLGQRPDYGKPTTQKRRREEGEEEKQTEKGKEPQPGEVVSIDGKDVDEALAAFDTPPHLRLQQYHHQNQPKNNNKDDEGEQEEREEREGEAPKDLKDYYVPLTAADVDRLRKSNDNVEDRIPVQQRYPTQLSVRVGAPFKSEHPDLYPQPAGVDVSQKLKEPLNEDLRKKIPPHHQHGGGGDENSVSPPQSGGRRREWTTPPHLRGFSTPQQPADIAYVKTGNPSRQTAAPQSKIFYPQKGEQDPLEPKSLPGVFDEVESAERKQRRLEEFYKDPSSRRNQHQPQNHHHHQEEEEDPADYNYYDDPDHHHHHHRQPKKGGGKQEQEEYYDDNDGDYDDGEGEEIPTIDVSTGARRRVQPKPRGVPKHGSFSKGVVMNKNDPNNNQQRQQQQQPPSSHLNQKNASPDPFEQEMIRRKKKDQQNVADQARKLQQQQQQRAAPPNASGRQNIPTWLDLMNEKTHLEREFTPEFLDIAALRLEQQAGQKDYELDHFKTIPSRAAQAAARESSKVAGLPTSSPWGQGPKTTTEGGAAAAGSRPPKGNRPFYPSAASQGWLSDNNNDTTANPSSSSTSQQINDKLRDQRVAATAVPPAPKPAPTKLDHLGSKEDIRRHLDRMKLDQAEAVAKFRGDTAGTIL